MGAGQGQSDLKLLLHAELDAFEHLLHELSGISLRSDLEGRIQLVKLRRELADRLSTIGKAAQTFFAAESTHPWERDFRKRLSDVRSSIATHQANWPAVSINEANADFVRSAHSVREVNQAFLSWCRHTFS